MGEITIRQLEIFVQAVEMGSFRRCAEQIGLTQVAISDHVRALEAALGIALFDRRPGRAARMTAEGTRAFTRATRILGELSELRWDFAPGRHGRLRPRVTLATQGYVLRELYDELDRFRTDHAEVDLVIRAEPFGLAELRDMLAAGTADIAYFMAVDDPHLFASSFVGYEQLLVYVGQDHPLAGRTGVRAAELLAHRTIKLAAGGHLRAAVDDAMHRVGLGAAGAAIETDDYGLIVSTLKRTHCFACMLSGNTTHPLPHELLATVGLAHPLPPLQLREAMSARGMQSGLVKTLAARMRGWHQ